MQEIFLNLPTGLCRFIDQNIIIYDQRIICIYTRNTFKWLLHGTFITARILCARQITSYNFGKFNIAKSDLNSLANVVDYKGVPSIKINDILQIGLAVLEENQNSMLIVIAGFQEKHNEVKSVKLRF
jgi:hypothetical protein